MRAVSSNHRPTDQNSLAGAGPGHPQPAFSERGTAAMEKVLGWAALVIIISAIWGFFSYLSTPTRERDAALLRAQKPALELQEQRSRGSSRAPRPADVAE